MSKDKLVAELIYASYKANRDQFPHISVDRWRMVYRDIDLLEARYQFEKGESCRDSDKK